MGGGVRTAGRILGQPAMAPFDGASSRPARAWRPTSRSSRGSPATPRRLCTPRAPAGWGPTTCRSWTRGLSVHGLEGARRRRVRVPVRDERQHLRAGDDGGREGRGPDPRNTPLAPEPLEFYRRVAAAATQATPSSTRPPITIAMPRYWVGTGRSCKRTTRPAPGSTGRWRRRPSRSTRGRPRRRARTRWSRRAP